MAECQGMFKMQHDLDKVFACSYLSIALHLCHFRFLTLNVGLTDSLQDLKFVHAFPRTRPLPPPVDADSTDGEAALPGEADVV